MGSVYFKDPDSIADISIDWSGLLAGRTISSAAWSVSSGITTSNESATSSVTSIRFDGGVDGQTYQADCTITLTGGVTYQRSLFVRVRDILVDEADQPNLVTLNDAKHHLRVTGNHDDERIDFLVKAATEFVEGSTGKSFSEKTFSIVTDKFDHTFFISNTPVIAVARVQYFDTSNVLQVLAPSKWLTYDQDGATALTHAPGQEWPDVYDRPDAVRITGFSGYESGKVPALAKQAVLMLVRDWYDTPGLGVGATPPWLTPMLWSLKAGNVINHE